MLKSQSELASVSPELDPWLDPLPDPDPEFWPWCSWWKLLFELALGPSGIPKSQSEPASVSLEWDSSYYVD